MIVDGRRYWKIDSKLLISVSKLRMLKALLIVSFKRIREIVSHKLAVIVLVLSGLASLAAITGYDLRSLLGDKVEPIKQEGNVTNAQSEEFISPGDSAALISNTIVNGPIIGVNKAPIVITYDQRSSLDSIQ